MSHRIVLGLIALSSIAGATELPSAYTRKDIHEASRVLAWGSYHRAWTAPALPEDAIVGFQLGLESSFVPRGNLLKRGDGAGVIPRVVPIPRLWGAWDLPLGFEASFSFAPGMAYDGVTAYGSALQWTFVDFAEAKLSVLLGYTHSNAFGDLKSNTFNAAFQASRDLELWEPYAGAGFISANSTLAQKRVAPGEDDGPYTLAAFHAYVGAEVRMPARLAFQLDFMNTKASFAFLLGHTF